MLAPCVICLLVIHLLRQRHAVCRSSLYADHLWIRFAVGEIPPGAHVLDRNFCASLKIFRTPLREAPKVLAAEGLIVLLPHRGSRAAKLAGDPGAISSRSARAERWALTLREHEGILNALLRRDGAGLSHILRAHLRHKLEEVTRAGFAKTTASISTGMHRGVGTPSSIARRSFASQARS